MRGPRSPIKIVLTEKEKQELEGMLQDSNTSTELGKRIKSILFLAEGKRVSHIKNDIKLERRIIRKWAYRFLKDRMNGLEDSPRSGRPKVFPADLEEHLLRLVAEPPQRYGYSSKRWSCNKLGKQLVRKGVVDKISVESVRRILRRKDINLKESSKS